MSSDVRVEGKVSPTNEEETASAATSEEYEIVKESSPSPEGDRLVVSDKESMEESLKECIEENGDGNKTITDLTTVINNENLLDDPDHTIFHNVVYLGSVRVNNPKDEVTIQEHMSVMNQSIIIIIIIGDHPGAHVRHEPVQRVAPLCHCLRTQELQ